MHTILMFVTPIGLVAGSLVAAVALTWFLWWLFALFHHPEWAATVILVLVVLLLTGNLPSSDLLDMSVSFALVAAIPLWFEGRQWRRRYLGAAAPARGQAAN